MIKTMHLTGNVTMTTATPGVLLLHVPGISDSKSCEQFELVIMRALAARPRVVVVDLSQADSVSTVMLGLLLKLRRGAAALGGEVRLADVQPMVRRVLNICRLDQLFSIFSSCEAAMAVCKPVAAM
jgi:anti-anti-sigma factor